MTNSTSPTVTIDVSALSFVDGDYEVDGAAATDAALRTISGDLDIAHGGVAEYSHITSVGGDVTVDSEITELNLARVSIDGDLSTDGLAAGNLTLSKATTVNVGTAEVSTVSLTLAKGTIALGFDGDIATSVLIEAPEASAIDFAAETVDETLIVTADDDAKVLNASNLETTSGIATITAQQANFPALTQFGGNSVITAENLLAPKLVIASTVAATVAE